MVGMEEPEKEVCRDMHVPVHVYSAGHAPKVCWWGGASLYGRKSEGACLCLGAACI